MPGNCDTTWVIQSKCDRPDFAVPEPPPIDLTVGWVQLDRADWLPLGTTLEADSWVPIEDA